MKGIQKLALTKAAGKLAILLSLTGTSFAAPELAFQTQRARAYGQLPLRFEVNQGQTAPQARLFLTTKEVVVLVLQKPGTQEDLSKGSG